MSKTTMKELTPAFLDKLAGRPLPFKASYHGDSTIIVDAGGQWVTQQVPQDQADQIALSMTAYLEQQTGKSGDSETRFMNHLKETIDRQAKVISEFKGRYHEMGQRITFLEGKLEDCKSLVLDVAYGKSPDLARDAQKLISNWPSEALYRQFNEDSLLNRLSAIVPKPPKAITWECGVEILNLVQSATWKDEPLPATTHHKGLLDRSARESRH